MGMFDVRERGRVSRGGKANVENTGFAFRVFFVKGRERKSSECWQLLETEPSEHWLMNTHVHTRVVSLVSH